MHHELLLRRVVLMLGCAAADAPMAPWHCDLALESTMPQTKWCGTPGGVGVVEGTNDGLGRHDPGQWRPAMALQYLMLIVVDLMRK